MLENIKFRKIEQLLLRELMGPAYKVSDKLESETALARKFNVSKVTIRSALKRLEDDSIILCEHGKRRVLLRKPTETARIRSGMSFGFFMRGEYLTTSNDLLGVSRGLAEGLRAWKADLLILPMSGKLSELEFVKRVVGRNMVDGLFVTSMEEGPAIVEYLQGVDFPCVSFNNMENSPRYDGVPYVGLREIDALNSFARGFREIHVVGCAAPSLDRTMLLLDPGLPLEIHQTRPEACEGILCELIDALVDDNLLIIASLELLPVIDLITRRTPAAGCRGNVLVLQALSCRLVAIPGAIPAF